MTTTLTPATSVRDALLAAATLADAQRHRTAALTAALGLLDRFPGAVPAWQEAEGATGLSVALVLAQRATCPGDIARSLRNAAGGAR